MLRTIAALFDNRRNAQDVVDELERSGFSRAGITLVARSSDRGRKNLAAAAIMADRFAATGMRILAGAVAGAFVAVIAATILILAIGSAAGLPTNAANVVLLAAIAGGMAGIIIGLFTTFGLTDEDAQLYAEGVRRGLTLVAVDSDAERAPVVEGIMRAHHPVDVERRADRLRSRPWLLASTSALATDEHRHARASALATVPRTTSHVYDFYSAMTGRRDAGTARKRQERPGRATPLTTPTEDRTPYPETAFRSHFNQHYARAGNRYDEFAPAYRYGYLRGSNARAWEFHLADTRAGWEKLQPGTWNRYSEAIHQGWVLAATADQHR